MNGASTPQPAGLGQAGTGLNRPQQLSITKVSNGFVVGNTYGVNDTQVALDEASMLDLVKSYFADQPNQPQVEQSIQRAILDYLRWRGIPCYEHQNAGIRKPDGSYIPTPSGCKADPALRDKVLVSKALYFNTIRAAY
jgi:hypothetical protein